MSILLTAPLCLRCACPHCFSPSVCFLSGKSFLRNRLFKGLDSWPPRSFCVSRMWSCCQVAVSHCVPCLECLLFPSFGCLQTQKPRRFDDELPDISIEDLQYLKSCCPLEVQPFLMYVLVYGKPSSRLASLLPINHNLVLTVLPGTLLNISCCAVAPRGGAISPRTF